MRITVILFSCVVVTAVDFGRAHMDLETADQHFCDKSSSRHRHPSEQTCRCRFTEAHNMKKPKDTIMHEAVCERSEHSSVSEASALVRESLPFFHMRRTNMWHFLQQSGQFLRLSGQARSEAEGGPTALEIVHFVE